MIGRVVFKTGAVATLGDDGTWSVSGVPHLVGKLFAESLSTRYPRQGPQDGDGAWPVRDLAERVGGTAEVEAKEPPPEGVIH